MIFYLLKENFLIKLLNFTTKHYTSGSGLTTKYIFIRVNPMNHKKMCFFLQTLVYISPNQHYYQRHKDPFSTES